jgi:hypothetical protein
VVVEEPLPRFLVFLGSHVFLAIVDLGGVFESYLVEHVSGDFGGAIREAEWEAIGKFEPRLCVLLLEDLLK